MSFFSSLFGRSGAASDAAAEALPNGVPLLAAAPRASALRDAPFGTALAKMLSRLEQELGELAPAGGGVPERSVQVASLRERAVGIGDLRGTERRGSFGPVELKGLRLEAIVRFQLWHKGPSDVSADLRALGALLAAHRHVLRAEGFLRLALESTSAAAPIDNPAAWGISADYRVLYEFAYQDDAGDESLIASIPIASDLEAFDSPDREITTISDEMVRWDNESAPVLVVRGRVPIAGLSSLAFLSPMAPSGTVKLTRSFDSAGGDAVVHPSLSAFFAAVGGANPVDRHATVTIASVKDFLDSFESAGADVVLGDWDRARQPQFSDSVPYVAGQLRIDPAIELPSPRDRFEIRYEHPQLDKPAVVYLRAGGPTSLVTTKS